MTEKCQIIHCQNNVEFGCSCKKDLRLCKDHMFDHFGQPGLHNRIDLSSILRRKIGDQYLNQLDAKRKLIQNEGRILIAEIIKMIYTIDQAIQANEKEILKIIASNTEIANFKQNIENISKISFEIKIEKEVNNCFNKFFDIIKIQIKSDHIENANAIEAPMEERKLTAKPVTRKKKKKSPQKINTLLSSADRLE